MDMKEAQKALSGVLQENQIITDAPMSEHTTFRTGGCADLLLLPSSGEQLAQTLHLLREHGIHALVIGRGSNLIVRDGGIRGAVVKLGENFSSIRVDGELLYAEAGATLAALVREAHAHALCGMEYAGGIPGTVGGAVCMNAGAYDGEMKDHLQSVTVLDKQLTLVTLTAKELGLGYRTSIIAPQGYTVLTACFRLTQGDLDTAKEHLKCLNQRRRDKQPLEYPSAGSTFKRPPGHFAGALIEQAGLRGFAVGGAQVSEKHCGFVINTGTATSSDILSLIAEVQKRVLEHSGVALETEVKIIGEEKA
jgi:UDP-N-acetylmuramate dehydrogenase